MQASQTPTLVPLPFAANGTKNTIPEASQIGTNPGAASLNDGFPPLTFTPIAAGGIPPAGADFNGILNLITQSIRWAHAGGRYAFSSTFSADANVVGYPAGSVLMSADRQGSWLSLNDNNTDNPDTGPGVQWVPSHAYGVTAITGLTNSNVTLTPAQAMKPKITLAGTLTGNVQIIFPAWIREWIVVNSTTGAFTVTAKTAAGSGVVLAAGQQRVTGDGTNIVQPAESIAAATQSTQPMQLGQATGRLLRTTVLINNGGTLQSSIDGAAFANASSTFTPLTATTSVEVEVLGGGGGGGGSAATGANQVSAGGGGGAGGYARKRIMSGFSGVAITVGAGGNAPAGAAGGNGGSSSFGSLLSATGGVGGSFGAAASNTTNSLNGGSPGGSGSSGTINASGGMGQAAFYAATPVSGKGGASFYGEGAFPVSNTSGGNAASSYGSGGSGGSLSPNSLAAAGGVGAGGLVIVREYA
jgi:hypothetical protein